MKAIRAGMQRSPHQCGKRIDDAAEFVLYTGPFAVVAVTGECATLRANVDHTLVSVCGRLREGKMADPADVARDGYKALIKGDDHIVTPLADKISATLAKFVPDRMAVQRAE
jgi:short-subunit dehydrogenase